ncbi:hypothetical protein [Parahaliea mediterranea]|uniref:Bacterial repeat domain-containing protein n=1 Tax=Parahaliea mediterranea TaxID=651086 RepID=A0A939IMC0_9GAMM|nr:hypothetical protein [Parahaliea mediterranea]MBN7796878.1 hypothetical protein [Parahaliea mediterranea]
MRRTIIGLLFVISSLAVPGCKLAVIVVEGGEVRSTGSGTCVAGLVCVVDVTDTGFSDEFRAVPGEGWYFHKWNSGSRFFCGGSADPECKLYFSDYPGSEDNVQLQELVKSSEVFYLMPVFKQTPPEIAVPDNRPVRVNGQEWLQPRNFVNYSYNTIREVCPDKLCSGHLPGSAIDLTGYMWASGKDVRLLIESYKTRDRYILGDFIYTKAEMDRELEQVINLNLIALLSDDLSDEGWVHIVTAYDAQPFEPSREKLSIGANPFIRGSDHEDAYGAWFWRPVE